MRAATFAYDATAMPMLTGTLITAVGFLPIGLAQSTVGEYTFAIFAVTAAALVISWLVSVYFVPYLGTVLLEERRKAGSHEQPHELFDTPFYTRFRAVVAWCVRHRWITIGATVASLRARRRRHGHGAAAVLPRLEPARDAGRPVAARRAPSFAANEEVDQAVRGADPAGARRRRERDHLGRQRRRRASTCRSTRSSRRRNVSQMIVLPKDLKARETLRTRLAGAARRPSSPRCAARVKLLPNGPPVPYPVQFRVVGPDAVAGARLGRRGQGDHARQPEHARRQRQLERVGQGAAPRHRPGQGARARRHQPGRRAGVAHDRHRGNNDRPVPRRRQADRHRAAPAAPTSATRSPTWPTPTCRPPAARRCR